jgi:hypothetical protein
MWRYAAKKTYQNCPINMNTTLSRFSKTMKRISTERLLFLEKKLQTPATNGNKEPLIALSPNCAENLQFMKGA